MEGRLERASESRREGLRLEGLGRCAMMCLLGEDGEREREEEVVSGKY